MFLTCLDIVLTFFEIVYGGRGRDEGVGREGRARGMGEGAGWGGWGADGGGGCVPSTPTQGSHTVNAFIVESIL